MKGLKNPTLTFNWVKRNLWERKVLRKIFGEGLVDGAWRMKRNVISFLTKQPHRQPYETRSIHWERHIQRIEQEKRCLLKRQEEEEDVEDRVKDGWMTSRLT